MKEIIKDNKKIVVLIVSILLVIAILASSTYSLLIKTEETDLQTYTTGVLQITSETTNDSVTLSNSLPMEDEEGEKSTPYTFKITNTGNVNFKIKVMLLSTTTSNQINANYIKLKVNNNTPVTLGELTNGVILEDITILAKESVEITLRVWLDINTPNSELGKVLTAKIVTEGQAIYTSSETSTPALTTLTNLGLDDEINDTELTTFTGTSKQDETTGIYKTVDDLGDSYYFRGNVVNNYVKYGKNADGQDMWWRIIRINGDGSVRMIYDGTSAHTNNEASTDRQVGYSVYNTNGADNAFVGYMNGTTDGTNFPSGGTNSTSYEEAHANITDSTIKTYLENWYKTNIVDTGYSGNVVDAIYCNDRTRVTDTTKMAALKNALFGWNATGEGYGTYVTYYGLFNRVTNDVTGVTPSLICSRQEDKFTKNSLLGNGKLSYPVGLITLDELTFGGAFLHVVENDQTYLYNGTSGYWTMSPFFFHVGSGDVGYAYEGAFNGSGVSNSGFGVRPVITLSSSAINDGSGSSTDPFVVIPPPALTTLTNLGLDDEINDTELTTFTTSSNNDGTTGIYKTVDDLGDSYYFRGNVVNNYVKYGKNADGQDMWWRIIRINGDGSVRMIYDGTSAHTNNEVSEDRHVGTSAYNVNSGDNAFIGYMNGTTDGTNFPSGGTNSTSYEEAHANITDSTIKTYLDNWYKTNIVDTGYSDNVVDAIYCNDRTRVTDSTGATGEGFGTYETYYALFNRITNDATGVTPSLICSRQEDKFTRNSTLGNGKLTYPVGLITTDELVFGGAFLYMSDEYMNAQTYLYNGINWYWTMSPLVFTDGSAEVGRGAQGSISLFGSVDGSGNGVRPVISILASAINDGSGISTDPFIVS